MSDDEYRSRTARRRSERDRLDDRQTLLDALAALPEEERDALPAEGELKLGIDQLAGMKADSARRRLIRHLARRTPDDAWPPLEAVLNRSKATTAEGAAVEREAEAWRTRLIAEGDAAVDALVAAFPDADRGRLRQLVRNASRPDGPATRRGRRLLFRAVRALLIGAPVEVEGDDEDDADESP